MRDWGIGRRTTLAAVGLGLGAALAVVLVGLLVLRDDGEDGGSLAPPIDLPNGSPRPSFGTLPAVQAIEKLIAARRGQTSKSVWAALEAKARRNGTVPVIVELKAPNDLLTRLRPSAQEALINRLADAVLRGLAGTRFDNLKRFTTVPVIALHASVATLRILRRFDLVASIQEDRALPLPEPQPGEEISPPEAAQKLENGWDIEVSGRPSDRGGLLLDERELSWRGQAAGRDRERSAV